MDEQEFINLSDSVIEKAKSVLKANNHARQLAVNLYKIKRNFPNIELGTRLNDLKRELERSLVALETERSNCAAFLESFKK